MFYTHPGVIQSVHEKGTRFHCEFYDAYEDLGSQVLATCRMLS